MNAITEVGVEYGVNIKNKGYEVIISLENLEKRLLKSKYYSKRRIFYIKNYGKKWHTKINEPIDIVLSDDETTKINTLLNYYQNEVIEHGWYDVSHHLYTYC